LSTTVTTDAPTTGVPPIAADAPPPPRGRHLELVRRRPRLVHINAVHAWRNSRQACFPQGDWEFASDYAQPIEEAASLLMLQPLIAAWCQRGFIPVLVSLEEMEEVEQHVLPHLVWWINDWVAEGLDTVQLVKDADLEQEYRRHLQRCYGV
jgi:hypothetical protein